MKDKISAIDTLSLVTSVLQIQNNNHEPKEEKSPSEIIGPNIAEEKLLELLLYSGNIDSNAARKLVEMKKTQDLVQKNHEYEIYQQKDGRWCTYIRDESKPYHRRKVVKRTYTELLEYLYEIYRKQECTLEILYPEWLDYKRQRSASDLYPERIDRDWKRFYLNDQIIHIPLSELTKLSLEKWVLEKIKKFDLTKTAYYNMTIILRQCLDYAVEIELINTNPFRKVKIDTRRLLRKVEKKDDKDQVFTDEEVKKLEKICWNDFHDKGKKRYRLAPLAVLFQFYTGLRVGELTGLKHEDIHEKYICVRRMVRREDHKVVEHAKTDAGIRDVPLTKSALKIIKAVKTLSSEGWLFSEHDHPLPSRIVEEYFQKYCKELNTSHKSSHCARKTYTSALMDANINIRTIAKTVGHADERTTLRNYTFDRNEEKERVKRIEKALTYS